MTCANKSFQFSLKTVSETQVLKAIKSLKNKSSSGVDMISPKIVKMAAEVIKIPLTAIINSSIVQGVFPESWKWAKIIPIFKKKGSRLDKMNYRPVSLLKSASKVLYYCWMVSVTFFAILYIEIRGIWYHQPLTVS